MVGTGATSKRQRPPRNGFREGLAQTLLLLRQWPVPLQPQFDCCQAVVFVVGYDAM